MNTPNTTVECLFSPDAIAARVRELAIQVSADYAGKQPLLVGILKGSWIFMADLVRHLTLPVRCDFVKLASYGKGMTTTGEVRVDLDLTQPIGGEDVLIVEDIIDTGTSTSWLIDHFRLKRPASVRLCALLDKPSRRRVPVPIDYLGFSIPDHFVVGYGIDYAEQYRELPYIGYLVQGEPNHASS
jgi:hypoxanthine phosphoribosyltransferase